MRQTILLADDSPTIQRLVAQTFAEGNFEVISVSNGEAAIRRFDEVQPDVVLADIYMPGRSGYEVCAYVRGHQSLGATPVILLVGAFDAFDEATATQAGATANITKPFEPRALIELVQSVAAQAPPRAERKSERAAASAAPKAQAATVAKNPAPAEAVAAAPESSVKAEPPSAPAIPSESDILGLSALFTAEPPVSGVEIGEADVERIAERVMQKLSAQAVESVAWDVVPEIAQKVIRETLKKTE